MRIPLERLSLQGYKSFARNTELLFERGITAIVGPNGSGKSNVADAIRWVLGEQSYGTLRARRTEDMIFSGSDGHRRLGMAQASLSFANQGRWLPIDFAQVTISRRAYRSGENEYLLNQARVRLRDISELLIEAGLSTYTVIGQGMVDRALALNSQERRLLFEEAAGIIGYRTRRGQALRRLEETEGNLLRIRDIVGEIAPRLAHLARQAEDVEEQTLLSRQLEEALYIWYGHRWQTGQDRLSETRAHARRQAALLTEAQGQLRTVQQEMANLRSASAQSESRYSTISEERQRLEQHLAELGREQAVWEERERLLSQRRVESIEERSELQSQESAQALRITELESALAQLVAVGHKQQAEIRRLHSETASLERERSRLQEEIRTLRQEAGELSQARAERRGEWSQLHQRRSVLLAAQARRQEAIRREQDRVAGIEEESRATIGQREKLAAQLSALEEQIQGLTDEREAQRNRQQRLHGIGQQLEQELARVGERRKGLSRMRRQAYSPGVQTVLAAAREGLLAGVRGLVAELLEVPREWEEVVQAALGDQLQDIVVEDWTAARAAVAYLTESQRGRAAFLPLGALRLPSPVEAPAGDGVIGWANELVPPVADDLLGVAACLLGRTLVVRDLDIAQCLLPSLAKGYRIVTLGGELLRSDGSVAGGSEPEIGSDVVALEREWRQLPQLESQLGSRLKELAAQEQEAATQRDALHRSMEQLEEEARVLRTAMDEHAAKTASLSQTLERSVRTLDWERERATQESKELDALNRRQVSLQETLSGLEIRESETRERLLRTEEQWGSLGTAEARGELEAARTAYAVAQEALRREQERLEDYTARRQQTLQRIDQLARRQSVAVEELAELQSEIQRLVQREEESRSNLLLLVEQEREAGESIRSFRSEEQSLARTEQDVRQRLREYEGRAHQASLVVVRREDELRRLQDRILSDLELTHLDDLDNVYRSQDLPTQASLPLASLADSLPKVVELPEGLTERIDLLRSQLRRLRRINPDAPAEYAELKARHEFLVDQASDLETAAASLREVVAELDQLVESRFRRTFQAVAEQFEEYFSHLFDGGRAQVILTEPQDLGHTGVDVRVRPPGKREQELALLSGGERALTAVALIFAFLSVSTTPFCLLDEVDATLDEANSVRFRHLLERLAERTQFVVITHNRQTIEAAGTVYGISMDEDGVSQVISLRLDGVAAAAEP